MFKHKSAKCVSQRVTDLISKFERLSDSRDKSVRKINTRSLYIPAQNSTQVSKYRQCTSLDNSAVLEKEVQDDIFEVIAEKNKEVKDSETQTCISYSDENKAFINECSGEHDDEMYVKLKIPSKKEDYDKVPNAPKTLNEDLRREIQDFRKNDKTKLKTVPIIEDFDGAPKLTRVLNEDIFGEIKDFRENNKVKHPNTANFDTAHNVQKVLNEDLRRENESFRENDKLKLNKHTNTANFDKAHEVPHVFNEDFRGKYKSKPLIEGFDKVSKVPCVLNEDLCGEIKEFRGNDKAKLNRDSVSTNCGTISKESRVLNKNFRGNDKAKLRKNQIIDDCPGNDKMELKNEASSIVDQVKDEKNNNWVATHDSEVRIKKEEENRNLELMENDINVIENHLDGYLQKNAIVKSDATLDLAEKNCKDEVGVISDKILEDERIKAKQAYKEYYNTIVNDSFDGYQPEVIYENLPEVFDSSDSDDDNSSNTNNVWVSNEIYENHRVELRRRKNHIYEKISEDEDSDEEISRRRKISHSMVVQVNVRSSNSESDNTYYYKESTIYDANKNLRIKSISKVLMDKSTLNENEEKKEIKYKDRQEYIVDELIRTEEKYVEGIEYVVDNYLNYMRENIVSGCLVGKYTYIFVNIENILIESKIFLQDLKRHKSNYEQIGKIFLHHKNLLHRYPIYCRSNNRATTYLQGDFKQIVKIRELELDDKLGLSSHLLKPIQRLGKYELLLTRLYNCLEMEGSPSRSVKDAILLVQQVTRRGNDLITIDSIESNPFGIIDTGDFVMRENFKLLSPKREIVLFLFKKMIIITYKDTKSIDHFVYKDSILITSLSLINMESSLVFSIEDYYKKKKKDSCSFQIECKDVQVKELWMKEIQDMLWAQLHEHKEAAKRQQNGDSRRNSFIDCKRTAEDIKDKRRAQQTKSRFFVEIPR